MKVINILLAIFLIFFVTSAFATEARVCPPCPYHPCPTDFITLIKKDVTISVPGILPIAPFTQVDTIQDALDALENYKISKKATVTIQLTQNADNYDTINITHPDGDKIRIVGNCGGGACTIQFKPGATGVYIAGGNKLGYLNNFNLIGKNIDGIRGISVIQNSSLICGSNITVQHFDNGVFSDNNSFIAIQNATVNYNNYDGVVANSGTTIYITNSHVENNGEFGINSDRDSFVDATQTVCENNYQGGIRAHMGSVICAEKAQSNNNNGRQFEATGNSLIFAYSSATAKGSNPVYTDSGGRVCGVNGGGCVPP